MRAEAFLFGALTAACSRRARPWAFNFRCGIRAEVTSEPRVSVIIIFLNAERFIDEAIESVFTQEFTNWELLLVDDGSTDASTTIARSYAERHNERVFYLEHPGHQNRGMSASRNLGIAHARGEHIAFLDADDVWLPQKLRWQVEIMDAHPEAQMVYGAIQWWYSWTRHSDNGRRDFVAAPNLPTDTLIQPPQMLVALLKRAGVSTTSSLLRREIIDRVGGFEENFRGLYEDQAFAAKIYTRAPVFVADGCGYKWRKHPNSSCDIAVQSGEYNNARLTFLHWLEKYMAEHEIENAEIREVLWDELWKCRHARLESLRELIRSAPQSVKGIVKKLARRLLPVSAQHWLSVYWHGDRYCPPVGLVHFGSLRRLTPISRVWGADRGLPVDRYYIEGFLSRQAAHIRGRVLEIGDNSYTRRFGGDRVTRSDILHVQPSPQATIVADLAAADDLPADVFDCIICTQTLMFIYDVGAAIRNLHRMLKPGGVLLVTVAGVSHQISREDMNRWGDYWRFTTLSARRVFEDFFPAANLTIEAHGNVLAAIAFLQGLATEELSQQELDVRDPDYEVLIAVSGQKPGAG